MTAHHPSRSPQRRRPGSALLLAGALLAAAPLAHADSLRLGLAYILFHDSNSDLTQTGGFPANATPAGLNSHVQPTATLLLTYNLELTDHISAEFVGGIPPHFRIKGKGPTVDGTRPYDGATLITGSAIAPSAFLEYHFFQPGDIRPMLGIGYSYIRFVKTKMTEQGAAVAGGPSRVDFSASRGITYLAGVEVPIDRSSSLILSMARPVNHTTVTIRTANSLTREVGSSLGITQWNLLYSSDL